MFCLVEIALWLVRTTILLATGYESEGQTLCNNKAEELVHGIAIKTQKDTFIAALLVSYTALQD